MNAFKYIDTLQQCQHVALFYEEDEFAKLIEFRFIKDGLARGEQCMHATGEDSGKIVLEMLSYGIPIKYMHNKMLRVIHVAAKGGSEEKILEKSRIEAQEILSMLRPPFRIVARLIPEVGTKNGIAAQVRMEQETHEEFSKFGGSLICPYNISKIEPSRRQEWVEQIIRNHHATIFAKNFDESKVLHQ